MHRTNNEYAGDVDTQANSSLITLITLQWNRPRPVSVTDCYLALTHANACARINQETVQCQ